MIFTIQYITESKGGRPVAGSARVSQTFTFEETKEMKDILAEVETFLTSKKTDTESAAVDMRKELVQKLAELDAKFPDAKEDKGK